MTTTAWAAVLQRAMVTTRQVGLPFNAERFILNVIDELLNWEGP